MRRRRRGSRCCAGEPVTRAISWAFAGVVAIAVACGGDDRSLPSESTTSTHMTEVSVSATERRDRRIRDATPEDLSKMILGQQDVGNGFQRGEVPSPDARDAIAATNASFWSNELVQHSQLTGTTCVEDSVELYATAEEAVDHLKQARDTLLNITANPSVPDAQSLELSDPNVGDQSFAFLVRGTIDMLCNSYENRAIEQYFVYSRLNNLISHVSVITVDVGAGPEQAIRLAEKQHDRILNVLSSGAS